MFEDRQSFIVRATHTVETEVSIEARTPEEAESIYEAEYLSLDPLSIVDNMLEQVEAVPEEG